jgi:hypothetical protein
VLSPTSLYFLKVGYIEKVEHAEPAIRTATVCVNFWHRVSLRRILGNDLVGHCEFTETGREKCF